jgi:ATP-dependent Clp protease ATP-binding subunit ClpA
MNHSPEIENIIEQSIEYAKARKHQYVTVEHLLLSLINHPSFNKCVTGFGVDTEAMSHEITGYLDSLHAIVSSEPEVVYWAPSSYYY